MRRLDAVHALLSGIVLGTIIAACGAGGLSNIAQDNLPALLDIVAPAVESALKGEAPGVEPFCYLGDVDGVDVGAPDGKRIVGEIRCPLLVDGQ